MSYIADLHIHSPYSRATSRDMSLETIWKWAQLKGIGVMGTGDFTHPRWFSDLTHKLDPLGNGLFELRHTFRSGEIPPSCAADVFYLLTAEISCIYRKHGRTRKIHSIVMMPDFEGAARLTDRLSAIGNLRSDGRPILGLDAKDLLAMALDASPGAMLVPAHAWTPHFSLFGAFSGFDSLEECFEDLSDRIYAIETGLSSDPPMNRRFSALDGITLISNSDAHSPGKMGREANIFAGEPSYEAIARALKTGSGFEGTIEFFPEEGKYHYDGHRGCSVRCSPDETDAMGSLCPVCGKPLTIGVVHRVKELSDRPDGYRPTSGAGYYSVIPLLEVIAEVMGFTTASKAVLSEYFRVITLVGSEFAVLLHVPVGEIEKAGFPLLAEGVSRVREGKVHITPGYDGEYGKIRIFEDEEGKHIRKRSIIKTGRGRG